MGKIKKRDLDHFIGIGGCGMSAIAKIMMARGYKVSGSDIKESGTTIRLRDEGAKIFIGHDPDHIRHCDQVVVTTAVKEDNPELIFAREAGFPIKRRAEVLGWLMDKYNSKIAISGTHGKTTTTAMLATVLEFNNLDPTFSVGGDVSAYNMNAKAGNGRFFVTEADESDGSIIYLSPNALIVTNIEEDHLEYLGNLENIEKLFWKVIGKIPDGGLLVINVDNASSRKLAEKARAEKPTLKIKTYGVSADADYSIREVALSDYAGKAKIFQGDKYCGDLELGVPGIHNLENALSVVVMAELLGLAIPLSVTSLKSFQGTKRRFQLIGEVDGVTIIDDYAHHPSEIKATLAAARNGFKRRIVCAFQPHRYTRTMFMAKEFAKSFSDADIAIITDVYSAGESPIRGITGKSIVSEMKNATQAIYVSKKEEIIAVALKHLKPGDIFITMGAGDIYTVAKEMLMQLKSRKA